MAASLTDHARTKLPETVIGRDELFQRCLLKSMLIMISRVCGMTLLMVNLRMNCSTSDLHQLRYVPSAGDNVLGVVVDAKPKNFLVDFKGPALAFLPVLSFEGGTRRNIPKFEVGTLLYVRVVSANTGMNPEVSCMDANGKAAEYGVLKEGYMFESSTGLSRALLSSPPHPILEGLRKKLSFEIAVGINGRF